MTVRGGAAAVRRIVRSRRNACVLVLLAVLTTSVVAGCFPDHPVRRLATGRPPVDAPVAAAPTTKAAAAEPSGPVARPSTRPRRRPNIVVVMADDMRVDDLRYAPAVRRLVGRAGLTFENSFSPNPLCCPARASFLTGLYSHNHGVFSHVAPWGFGALDDSDTFAVALRRSGYQTAFVGKYLNGYGVMPSRVTGGPSLRYVPAGWTDWYGAVEPPWGSGFQGNTYNYYDTPFNINGEIDDGHQGEYQTDVLGRFSRSLVTKYHGSPRPFFLYLSFVAPHFGEPKEPDDVDWVPNNHGRLSDMRTPARPDWVKGRFDSVITRAPGMPADGGPSERHIGDKPRFMARLPELNATERAVLTDVARQRAESVYVLDRQVAKLVATLKHTHEWSNTVLMFTSDNGYFMGEHRQRTGKIKAHEPSLRVPFLVTGPGIPKGQTRYDPIDTIDLPTTITDLAKARRFRGHPYDGSSRTATIYEGDQGWTAPILTEGHIGSPDLLGQHAPGFDDARNSIGVRTPRYSYIKYSDGERELYDLERDANELENVADAPRYRSVVRALDRLWRQRKDCDGAACQTPLPASLQASAAQERSLSKRYWAAVEARYDDAW